jgi:gamma-glutamylputrescine oxidase
VYDTQFQIDYYRAVRQNRLLFGGQGTGTSWSPERINDYLLDRIQTVFPQLEQVQLDFSWSGISDFTLNGATDSRKTEDTVPVYMVHGWSGHGVAQTVRIGKAVPGGKRCFVIRRGRDGFVQMIFSPVPQSGITDQQALCAGNIV